MNEIIYLTKEAGCNYCNFSCLETILIILFIVLICYTLGGMGK